VGAFPDGQPALNLAAARLHIAGTAWSTKRYLNIELLKDQQMRGAINTSEFQMSAPVQPGNSGGPILDTSGRVLGMSQGVLGTLGAAGALGGAVPQNVNFAITSTTIIGFLQAHSVDYRVDTGGAKLESEHIAEEA
jgi:S1-C subfamily serine protease